MASKPPIFLEDQTDEDFFDKLVDDDDDHKGGVDDGVGEESHSKDVSGLGGENNLVDGDGDGEVKALANLSINEVDHGNVDLEMKDIGRSDGNLGEFSSVEEKEERVGDGAVTSSLVSSHSFCFDNGQVGEDEVVDSMGETGLVRESSGGVKEVQWSAFADSSDIGSGGFGSYDDFLTDFGQGVVGNVQSEDNAVFGNETITNAAAENVYGYTQVTEQLANGVDTNTAEYYESQYPGWKFDPNTGQWYQVDNTFGNATGQTSLETSGVNTQGNVSASGGQWGVSDVNSSQVFYSQQNVHNTVGSVSQVSTSGNASDWNHTLNQTREYQYPAHMIFDPQYPDWYYDTLAQEWRSLDAYHSSIQSAELMHHQHGQDNVQGISSNGLQVSGSVGVNVNQAYATSSGLYNQKVSNDGQSTFGMNSGSPVGYSEGQSWPNFDSNVYSNAHLNPQKFPDSRDNTPSYNESNKSLNRGNWDGSAGNGFQPFNHTPQQNGAVQYLTEFYSNQNSAKVSQPLFSNGHQVSYAPTETRTLTGRPPHALVAFGFGGKLLVMKNTGSAGFSLQGSKDAEGHSFSVLNLMEVVGVNHGPLGTAVCGSSYFQSLCHQSFPGPLVGGNAGSKELNRWIDERIANCETMSGNDGKGEGRKLLMSLLKVACQHYGKLRSYGADAGQKAEFVTIKASGIIFQDNDLPESAVASLFASAKRNSEQFSQNSAIAKCLMTLPSEAQIQATASEVQNLLISGRKREALQCAQEGQFWEFALILSRELGDQFYTDTVKRMAFSQLVAGSPLRTLCLLIAKKPEEVFTNTVIPAGNLLHASAMSPQPLQSASYSMLANWEENLAVITANRTESDHLVMTHLGDSLWKERNDVIAAHICYLIAEADFELYSDTSRLCLIGADHWNFPRTYASPEAIQRTELFEYAKVTGNSQFVLLPLQPYKLIYAHMLAEIGRVSDSLKYCQAVHKVLKNGRSPEVEMSKQLLSSLEDRIRTHQQSGYAANLAPGKIVGRLLNLFDSTAHRVVGGLPPPAPSTAMSNGHHYPSSGSKVRSSQSTMGMSSLMPSGSMEPINERAGDGSKKTLHSRSVSEPNIGRTPRPEQVDTSNEATSSSSDGKSSSSTGTSRFGRFSFGASIFQKTVGLVLKPRQGRQAKLGDTNKFYYDEKLKRWVEEGAEPPAEEPALAPPPTSTAFQAEKSDSYSKNAFNNALNLSGGSEPANSAPPGISMENPTFPPSSNQFSARGRMGVRSRYVDTFNKGGGASTNMFHAPSIPSSQPASLSSAKFFIPTASSQNQLTCGTETQSGNDVSENEEQKSLVPGKDPLQNLTQSPGTLHRFPSVDNISRPGIRIRNSSSGGPQSRRTASWSAIPSDAYTSPPTAEVKPSPLSFMPNNQSSGNLHNRGGSFGDDLHEVQL
ncbi:hypothetical protein KSS87_005055 [Heliosperma pusillum]|nr:hypothetical protein KSS87_005055 [Heliosperma pusillum]